MPFHSYRHAHLSCINTILADSALSLHTEQATCIRTHIFTEFTPSARNVLTWHHPERKRRRLTNVCMHRALSLSRMYTAHSRRVKQAQPGLHVLSTHVLSTQMSCRIPQWKVRFESRLVSPESQPSSKPSIFLVGSEVEHEDGTQRTYTVFPSR